MRKKGDNYLATRNYPNHSNRLISREEENELDALDIIIGLSREERSYLLSVWKADRNRPTVAIESPLGKSKPGVE